MATVSEVLLIGGRAGVGKTSIGAEIFAQVATLEVRHCLIEGDNLDLAYPAPHRQGIDLAEQNLAAMWRNYRRVGYHRMVYINTASVASVDELTWAMGDAPRVTAVLLTADDLTARRRLALREIGTAFNAHVERSDLAARELERLAPAWVHRVATDGRTVMDLAAELIDLTGWVSGSRVPR